MSAGPRSRMLRLPGGRGPRAAGGARTGTRGTRLLALALLALLGLGLAVGVRSAHAPAALTSARSEDLVRLLGTLDAQRQRLREQLTALQQSRDRLAGPGGGAAALDEARTRAAQLGILAGTSPATGPGVVVTVADPQGQVRADVLVDAVQELRDAGAEAIDLSGVRLGAGSYVLDAATGLSVDGRPVAAPYVLTAIGDPRTMATALRIPGGVVDTVASRGGASAGITERPTLTIHSLRPLATATYAAPIPG